MKDRLSSQMARQKVLVAGCGHLGSRLVDAFCQAGAQVSVIDREGEAFGRLDVSFSGKPIEGDCMDLHCLEQAGIRSASLFLACTDQENVNILISQAARQLYDVPTVICRIKSSEAASLLEPWSITAVSPVDVSVQRILSLIGKELG